MRTRSIYALQEVLRKLRDASKVENLVFEGGAAKGFAHAGVILALDKAGLLRDLKKVGGASIGSLFATALALGFSAAEIELMAYQLQLWRLIDLPALSTNPYHSPPNQVAIVFNLFYQCVQFLQSLVERIKKIYQYKGIFEGHAIENYVRTLIQNKLPHRTSLTFAELHQLSMNSPTVYKDLYIPTVDILNRNLTVYSHESSPDMPIELAVHCSMAFPLLFQAVFHRGKFHSDAGLYANLPLTLFDRHHINMRTLGVALANPTRINKMRQNAELTSQELPWLNFAALFALSPLDAQDAFHKQSGTPRTIYLNTEDVFLFNIFISNREIRKQIRNAENATDEFLQKRLQQIKSFILIVGLFKPQIQKYLFLPYTLFFKQPRKPIPLGEDKLHPNSRYSIGNG